MQHLMAACTSPPLRGGWLTVVFGFAGVSLHSEGIAINPQMPANWSSVRFSLQWQGRRLKVRIDQVRQLLEATLEAGAAMALIARGKPHELRRDQTLRVFAAKSYARQ